MDIVNLLDIAGISIAAALPVQEMQLTAAFITIMTKLAGNNTFIICITVGSAITFIIPTVLAFKAIKVLAGQIEPLRNEIAASSKAFTELITEIRQQRAENIELIRRQSELTSHVMELIERVSSRLKKIEINSGGE